MLLDWDLIDATHNPYPMEDPGMYFAEDGFRFERQSGDHRSHVKSQKAVTFNVSTPVDADLSH